MAPGHELATSAALDVRSGADADAGALILPATAAPRLGSISGTARRLTRVGPVASGISVALAGAGRAVAVTGQGSYSLGALPEGRYSVALSADGAQTVTLQQVAVSADAPTVLPEVLLRDATTGDLDGDGIPDSEDPDIDGDGVPNAQDAFPLDPTEWADSDGGGGAVAPTLDAPARLIAIAGKPVAFTVTAAHQSGPPALTVQGLPAGATFIDEGTGTASSSSAAPRARASQTPARSFSSSTSPRASGPSWRRTARCPRRGHSRACSMCPRRSWSISAAAARRRMVMATAAAARSPSLGGPTRT